MWILGKILTELKRGEMKVEQREPKAVTLAVCLPSCFPLFFVFFPFHLFSKNSVSRLQVSDLLSSSPWELGLDGISPRSLEYPLLTAFSLLSLIPSSLLQLVASTCVSRWVVR